MTLIFIEQASDCAYNYCGCFVELSYGIVDVDSDISVTRRLQVSRIPSIGAVVNGRSVFFQASEYNMKNLREFTRKLFPDDLFHSQLVGGVTNQKCLKLTACRVSARQE